MATQRIIAHRLRKMGIDFCTVLYDMKNAFGATKQQTMIDHCSELYAAKDRPYLSQRVLNIATTINASDGEVTFVNGEGGPMGTSEGP